LFERWNLQKRCLENELKKKNILNKMIREIRWNCDDLINLIKIWNDKLEDLDDKELVFYQPICNIDKQY
jgi:hypothetical protein